MENGMGPELKGTLAMSKGAGAKAYEEQEMLAFVATADELGAQKLEEYLSDNELEAVGVFQASGCEVFARTARELGQYAAGSVFRVGHCATTDVPPEMIYNPQSEYSPDWQ